MTWNCSGLYYVEIGCVSFLCIVFEEASDIPQCEKRTGIEPKISRAQ